MTYERKADREARRAQQRADLQRGLDIDVERGLLTVEVVNGRRMYALTEVCGETHPMLCEDEAGEVPLVCGLPRGHAGEHQDRRELQG